LNFFYDNNLKYDYKYLCVILEGIMIKIKRFYLRLEAQLSD